MKVLQRRCRMSSSESRTNKLCYVDPQTSQSLSYDQLLAELSRSPNNDDSSLDTPTIQPNASHEYSFIGSLLANVVRGNDIYFEIGRVVTWRNSKVDFEPSDDWLSALDAISQSTSRIRLATSGTTGEPKQIVHSISSLTRGVKTGGHHQDDVWGLAYPLHHLAGLQVLFQSLFNGNPLVNLFGMKPTAIHSTIEDFGITHLSCTTTFLKLMASRDELHPRVQRITTGGERFDENTRKIVTQSFPNSKYLNIYALTEVGNLLVSDGDLFSIPTELVGKLKVVENSLAIHRSLLADSETTPLATAQVDDQTDSSSSEFSPSSDDPSQWFITGDLVEVVSETPLTFRFSSRQVDIISVGGNKVIPHEVEQRLLGLPGIQQAAVYGKMNSVTGQIVACDLVAKPGISLDCDAIKQQLASILPRYAVPRFINVVQALRTTSSGKTCRHSETS